MARRIRTHTNPLAYPIPIKREAWTVVLDEKRPLYVDLGSGKSDFILGMAKLYPSDNYLGIEARKSVCDDVQKLIKKEGLNSGLDNCWCVQGNATISLKSMFLDREVSAYYIFFPDPWIKSKHIKRRMIVKEILDDLHDTLKDDGIIYLVSDVKEIFDAFSDILNSRFEKTQYLPLDVKSYWEKWHEQNGNTIYRLCFLKK